MKLEPRKSYAANILYTISESLWYNLRLEPFLNKARLQNARASIFFPALLQKFCIKLTYSGTDLAYKWNEWENIDEKKNYLVAYRKTVLGFWNEKDASLWEEETKNPEESCER